MELIILLFIHLRAIPDRKMVEMWLGEHSGSLATWMSFWPFLIVIVEKCLGPRGSQATSRAVQSLYEEIVDEVIIHLYCICTVLHQDNVTLAHDINSSMYVVNQTMCCSLHKLIGHFSSLISKVATFENKALQ